MLEQQNTPVALEETEVQELVSRLRGELLRPSDAGYEQACQVYNAMIEKRPALIAHCVDVADVIAAVNFAREHGLTLAVRGGGHSGPGLGTCDDGLVIDLSGMKGIRVDPSARTARVEGGCTWGEVDHATHAFGLATPSGFISTTGVGGLTLGGGIGYLSRTLGLTIDKVRVRHGSTTYLDDGYGSFASRSTVLGGSAVFEGAAVLLDKIRAAAARRLGCRPDEIETTDDAARTRGARRRTLGPRPAAQATARDRQPPRLRRGRLAAGKRTARHGLRSHGGLEPAGRRIRRADGRLRRS